MSRELYKKYGNYNDDGYFIMDHELWDYYARNPKEYKRKKRIAWLFLCIPIMGFIPCSLMFEEMGLDCF